MQFITGLFLSGYFKMTFHMYTISFICLGTEFAKLLTCSCSHGPAFARASLLQQFSASAEEHFLSLSSASACVKHGCSQCWPALEMIEWFNISEARRPNKLGAWFHIYEAWRPTKLGEWFHISEAWRLTESCYWKPYILVGWCKRGVTAVLINWSYISLALTQDLFIKISELTHSALKKIVIHDCWWKSIKIDTCSHRPENGLHFTDCIFKCIFLKKIQHSYSNFTEVCS